MNPMQVRTDNGKIPWTVRITVAVFCTQIEPCRIYGLRPLPVDLCINSVVAVPAIGFSSCLVIRFPVQHLFYASLGLDKGIGAVCQILQPAAIFGSVFVPLVDSDPDVLPLVCKHLSDSFDGRFRCAVIAGRIQPPHGILCVNRKDLAHTGGISDPERADAAPLGYIIVLGNTFSFAPRT